MKPEKRRARTEAEKSLRRETILAEALQLTREEGFDAVSMVKLARRIGTAKGTLYLYFETRDDLFVALYTELQVAWKQRVEARITKPLSDGAFVDVLVDEAEKEPLFLELGARVSSVIGRNLALERAVEFKLFLASVMTDLTALMSKRLGLTRARAEIAFLALWPLMIGTHQTTAVGPELARELARRTGSKRKPAAFRERFRAAALLVLKGLRA